MKKILVMAAMVAAMMVGQVNAALTTINFDDDSKWTAGSGGITSYQTNHVYSDAGFVFTGGPALRNGTAAQDGFAGALGTYSWRLRDASVAWTATYSDIAAGNVITQFGFDVRRWDGSPSPAYQISYSFDGGLNFTNDQLINNDFLNNSSDWRTYSKSFAAPMTVGAGDFIVRLSATSGERIMIDNFTFSAVPEPSALLLVGSIIGAGVLRRRRS